MPRKLNVTEMRPAERAPPMKFTFSLGIVAALLAVLVVWLVATGD